MRRERSRPTYDLNQAKWLARCGMFTINHRARRFIANRYGDEPEDVIKALFSTMQADDFRKSLILDILPGTWADVYAVKLFEKAWYIKFFIRENGDMGLGVLSANWDGYIH